MSPPAIRELGPADAPAFHALRLRALREHPEAFGRTPDEMDPVDVWARRLADDAGSDRDVMLGAFEGATLVGMAGCHRETPVKQRHIAFIWGMYVAPEHRRAGLARALLQAAIARARAWPGLDQLWLDVVTANTGARALYAACGFTSMGIKRHALKVGDRYYDEEMMGLDVRPPVSGSGA
ncbi:MAG TPA: GNAT family N-acetyltransferase [Terriglobales bacterium]|nr:GNAT family N-acetyltransferase [Terriglobales bacterium]